MPKVTFIEFNGTEHEIDAEMDRSVMQAATDNLVPGIDGDCGGECSCATCHVFVSEEWAERVGGPHETEISLLELAPDRGERSRLCCQIKMSDELDGLVVHLPEYQM
ncbi:MAG: 2Fe-2S iron-sulfur cluster binding domain-containing protein [Pseudomonadales bacterium]|nr:2Fe-2S iron-sulfur cluster binding domain-containing protein [Pseudomonadales bacterium]